MLIEIKSYCDRWRSRSISTERERERERWGRSLVVVVEVVKKEHWFIENNSNK